MKYTQEQLDLITEMYKAGAGRKAMEKATGLKKYQLYHVIYKKLALNPPMPRKTSKPKVVREITPEVMNRIIILTNWGYHCKEIAEDQAIHPSDVRRVIQEAENLGRIQKKV
jgi:hypothetical protein